MATRTRIIVVAELSAQGLSISAIARQLDRHRETMVGHHVVAAFVHEGLALTVCELIGFTAPGTQGVLVPDPGIGEEASS